MAMGRGETVNPLRICTFLLGGVPGQKKGKERSRQKEGASVRRQTGLWVVGRSLSLAGSVPGWLPAVCFSCPLAAPGLQPALGSRQRPSFELLFNY